MDILDLISSVEVTVRIEDIKALVREAQSEAWAEGHDAGWSGVPSDQNPYYL